MRREGEEPGRQLPRLGSSIPAGPAGVWWMALTLLTIGACALEQAESTDDSEIELASTRQAVIAAAIVPSDDTMLRSDLPASNAGASTELSTTAIGLSTDQRSLLRFAQSDVTNRVGTNKVYKATLELRVKSIPQGWVGGEVALHRVTKSWAEGSATWACAADSNVANATTDCTSANLWSMSPSSSSAAFVAAPTAKAKLYSTQGNITVRFDVTADVQAFLAGTANYGWILQGFGTGRSGGPVVFHSRQGSTAPKLLLDVGPDLCVTDANKVAPGQCGCGVPETDTDGDSFANCVEPVLTPAADTTLGGVNIDANNGTLEGLRVTSVSLVGLERSLVRFDQTQIAALAAGKTVFNATLELAVTDVALGWNGGRIEILAMNRAWQEGTGTDTAYKLPGATWACAADTDTSAFNVTRDCASTDRWGMTSTTEGPIPFASTATSSAEVYTGSTKIVRFDVTADVKKFLTGTPNHGWIIKGRDTLASAKWIIFGSRESAVPPKLLLNVGPACTTAVPAMDENGHLRNLTCQNSDNGKSPCELRIQARANSDRQNAARMYVARVYSPGEHLALTRDRSRKMLALSADATRRQQVCDGDDDQDLVPNATDQCPNTRPLRPTDDAGCEQTTLPTAPPRGAIDAILGGMGVVYDPRCIGAPTPSIPAMNSRFTALSNGSYGKHLLLFPWGNNQPSGCEVEFQIMATTVWADGSSHFSTITFPWPSSDGRILVTSNGYMFEIDPAKGGDEVQWGPNVRSVGVSARVVNGNGQASSWGATRWFSLPAHVGG